MGLRLQSDFAILDVKRGRVKLRKMVEEQDKYPAVVIYGFVDTVHGSDDGTSREFNVIVDRVEVPD